MKNHRVLTLYYHRVNDAKWDYNLLCVSPAKFRQQMLSLKYKYQIARFEDDFNSLDTDAVVITFDDGYRDNLKYALPVLEELGIPATIFISTGTMDQEKELWWDELERVLLVGSDFPAVFWLRDDEFECRWDTGAYEHRKNCYTGIHYLMKNFISPKKRENWLAQLWEWRGLKRTVRKSNLTLSLDDCRKLSESGLISLGGHTVSHSSLAGMDGKEQETEIHDSLECLSKITGKEITIFSYPFGTPGTDFNGNTIEICKKCGIKKAASTESALWNPSVDPYRIPRKIVRNWGVSEFEKMINDYWEERV